MGDWHRIKYTGVHEVDGTTPVSGVVDVYGESQDEVMSSYSTWKAIRASAKAWNNPINLRKPIDIQWEGYANGSRAPEIDPREEDPPSLENLIRVIKND